MLNVTFCVAITHSIMLRWGKEVDKLCLYTTESEKVDFIIENCFCFVFFAKQ